MSNPRSGLSLTEAMQRIAELEAENAALRARLEESAHPPACSSDTTVAQASTESPSDRALSPAEKIVIFRSLFRGREDVFAVRWEGRDGKGGYAPVCGNEWRPGLCEKPRIKCADCPNRAFLPVTDQVLSEHLRGRVTLGVYPLLPGDRCHFLAIDLDGEEWGQDAQALRAACETLGIPASLEISRSGNGAHLWVFFETAVAAAEARRLGTVLISLTCERGQLLKLGSYDRLFPSQDTLPKGGFGNLIALPLQRGPRDQGRSVFVDAELRPYPDQWQYLASVRRMSAEQLHAVTAQALGGRPPLDVAFLSTEDEAAPWRRAATPPRLDCELPPTVEAVLAKAVYFQKAGLPAPLLNRLMRLAAFQNPDFYRAQAMRMPVWNKPRVIGCAENFPQHIALPRGCLEAARALLTDHGVELKVRDERSNGEPLLAELRGALREDQRRAAKVMLRHDTGVLVAPTGFGKTVVAAAVIAARAVSTLVLVHRQELQAQWREQLATWLEGPDLRIGAIGGGRRRLGNGLDVAVMQSLLRDGAGEETVAQYGQVIVDECHHVSAVSFEGLLRKARARYVLGLTATPIRRDGQEPILFMQCGPLRHTAERPAESPMHLTVRSHLVADTVLEARETTIQELLGAVAHSPSRNAHIAADLRRAHGEGARALLLTERTGQVEALTDALGGDLPNVFVLHGRLSRRERVARIAALKALPDAAPRIVLATGKLVGEGFDHAPLDTLFLALPISWKGTLRQYAGRLSRAHAGKTAVVIHDYLDVDSPVLMRMWRRRLAGYKSMGYVVETDDEDSPTRRTRSLVAPPPLLPASAR
jgi:superfamily II DNA or RNA helicase